ncbi:MAG: hypothetical protein JW894_07690 [Bacteroidales bacterium]|nr:hypothetical protein [Bacteroidales bacterium]
MKKSWLFNSLLVIGSLIITFIIAEAVFRLMLYSKTSSFKHLREPSAYAIYIKEELEDFYNDDYWKLHFRFKVKKNNELPPNPILGWTGQFYWDTLGHYNYPQLGNRKPVLLYGDSFAQCVDTVQCFEDILNGDSLFSEKYFLLNYGVGGYGIDQICLLLENTMDKFDNPFVVLSFLTTDMDRCLLKFRDGQKPYFVINNGNLELKGVPITMGAKEYVEKNPPKVTSYLFNRFRNSKLYPVKQRKSKKQELIKQIKALNKAILEKAFTGLKERNIDFLVVIFQPEHHPADNWRLNFLKEICKENKVPYMCDLDIRKADPNFTPFDVFNYTIKNDGHPTSYMNTLVASEIKKFMTDTAFKQQITEGTFVWESAMVKNIRYYKKAILNTPEWYENIKEKATDRGISVDSMMVIDALFLIESEKAKTRKVIKDVDYFKKAIYSSPEWLEKIKKKAKRKGISTDSMVVLDAIFLVEEEKKNIK